MTTQNWMIAPLLGLLFPAMGFAEQIAQKTCADIMPVEVLIDGQKKTRIDLKNGSLLSCLPPQPNVTWTIKKDRWSDQDQANWENFVRGIGQAREQGKCNTVDTCLLSSGNPYKNAFDEKAVHFSDCADFPMYLRAYFAFKNNLPFSFANDIHSNPPTAAQLTVINATIEKAQQAYDDSFAQGLDPVKQDELKKKLDDMILDRDNFINGKQTVQMSDNGNYARGRTTVANKDFFSIIRRINNEVSSGNYRMLLTPPSAQQSDFYPVRISRETIRTGTTVYNANGHVGMVYDVRNDGTIMVIDAGIYSDVKTYAFNSGNFGTSRPNHGAQFKNWRPQYIDAAKYDANGNIIGGKTTLVPNEQLPDFSLELYFGNVDPMNVDYKKSQWIFKGTLMDKYEYIEQKVAAAGFTVDPVERIRQGTSELCDLLESRAVAVNRIVADGIYLQAHPDQIPESVYSTDDRIWESYSVYSKDVNIRSLALMIIASAKKFLTQQAAADPRLGYNGSNLKKDMIKAFISESSKCNVKYKNSSGKEINLTMGVALKRLTKMSATPYFCPSRMWGASTSAEMAGCEDGALKTDWYKTTQFLRNASNKDIDGWGGASLEELRQMAVKGQVSTKDRSADFDILTKLNEL